MKLAIIGSRSFTNVELLNRTLEQYRSKVTLVVSGAARGADTLGEQWAVRNNIKTLIFPADWDNLDVPNAIIRTGKNGKKYNANAGFERNKLIINNCDGALIFWDMKSPGTKNSISLLDKQHKPYKTVEI